MTLSTDNPDIQPLLPRLAASDAGVRRIALMALADLGDPDSLPWLVQAVASDPSASVRAEAAALLEAWDEPEVVHALCVALTDAEPAVAQAAAHSLAQLKSHEAGRVLLPWAEHPVAFVRASALRALRELRLPESAAPALLALADTDPGIRREAVGILGWLRHAPALQAIALRLREDPDLEVRRAAAGALGFASTDDVQRALLAGLQDPAWAVREEAATTLGKVGDLGSATALTQALADEYWQVRLRAARALGRLKLHAAQPALITLLGHSISNLRKEAALALGELGDQAAMTALRGAAEDQDPEVRKAVRIALAQLQS
ncbi:HEAT repeat domain-containing protein [Pseudomonas sp. KNUC1026]|uniref:HEAT repeat domain-containing protein n=1 Tax=Pseudomonas sp. KNUC1026 TaxID=2893890 RepID=UPI001F47EA63|nr:HEAT repeat domain-containing protein [Pseudomonas sp. KNUC1026]UFH51088.1 HEAT repeat domain-containing protein [Pseudomonas sp. KNUC1026]